MLLIADTFISDAFALTFDRLLADTAKQAGIKAEFWRPLKQPPITDLARFSHMIMSGSEASIVDDHPWEQPLAEVLDAFMAAGKPVLGICYSHQFIAKRLLGRKHVRHSACPEFGYRRIEFSANPLFAGIETPLVSVVSHFDEVLDLGENFDVLASTPDCAVQAFQLKGAPVWGVQFHPEYGPGSIEEIFVEVNAIFPGFRSRYFDERSRPGETDQNRMIFTNFLKQ